MCVVSLGNLVGITIFFSKPIFLLTFPLSYNQVLDPCQILALGQLNAPF